MKKNLCRCIVYVALLLTAFTLAGCPGKETQTARDNLVRAEAMIEAAEITNADMAAPQAMAKARSELARATTYYEIEPKTGRLSNNLKINSQLKGQALVNSINAQENARLALLTVNGQATDIAPAPGSNHNVAELQNACTEKLENSATELKGCRDEINIIRVSATTGPATLAPKPSLYDELQSALLASMGPELNEMDASIQTGSLSIRFGEHNGLFSRDSAEITPEARKVLERFFPRFIEIIMNPEFKNRIKEIRVEGHTSSYYRNAKNDGDKYYLNLLLSQKRAANTIGVLMNQPSLRDNRWLQTRLYAAGMSSSSPVLNTDGTENYEKSRRIEFRVITSD
jgi:outer membrane protein OmpA-like peptidoglycan-associated protein